MEKRGSGRGLRGAEEGGRGGKGGDGEGGGGGGGEEIVLTDTDVFLLVILT